MRYIPSPWIISRWKRYISNRETREFYLNYECTMGIPKGFNKKYYEELGTVKMKIPKNASAIKFPFNCSFDTHLIRKALWVLRRRKIVTLGVFRPKWKRDEMSVVLSLSSRGEYVFIAPILGYAPPYSVHIKDVIEGKVPEKLAVYILREKIDNART